MGRNHVAESENVLHHPAHPVEAFAAGIALVAAHEGGPLLGRHGAGAGVGEQVDEDVAGGDREQVVAGFFQVLLALGDGSVAEKLDALDLERLDNGFHKRSR